jgi:hypothetical protein
MYPPVFSTCAADPAVLAVLADESGRIRLYPFGEAPQHDPHVYAVWQIVYGVPENYLSCPPDMDLHGVQVDVYARTADEARAAAQALRDAIETTAYVVSWNGETRDPTTRAYRISFTSDWHSPRA